MQAKLTILPGVQVLFMNSGAGLNFGTNGQLEAIGTPANPITFTSGQPSPARGDWVGLSFATDALSMTMQYALIEYAGKGIDLKVNSSNAILSNTFRYLGNGAVGSSGAIIGARRKTAVSATTPSTVPPPGFC